MDEIQAVERHHAGATILHVKLDVSRDAPAEWGREKSGLGPGSLSGGQRGPAAQPLASQPDSFPFYFYACRGAQGLLQRYCSIGDVHGRSRDYHEELSLGKRVLCCCEGWGAGLVPVTVSTVLSVPWYTASPP